MSRTLTCKVLVCSVRFPVYEILCTISAREAHVAEGHLGIILHMTNMFQTTKAPIDANLSNGKDGTPEESPSNIFVELEVVLQSNTVFNDRIFPLFVLFCILEAIIVIDPAFEKIVDCCKVL